MDRIAAFVGHSFLEGDADVVRKFIDLFDHISDMGIGFSWVHAEDAEPKILSEKVLELIKDKNLFIGICTPKERAIEQHKLKPALLSKRRYCGDVNDYAWKASDWIIQEIGLAIGRGMKVILLIEKGLRDPGGLQGNLEYITFERNKPEAVFTKILEMIKSLRPGLSTIPPATVESVSSEKVEEKRGAEDLEWLKPKVEWERKNYSRALIHMLMTEDDAGAQRIYDAYLSTPDGKIENNKASWAAEREYWKIITGRGGALSKLETMARENSANGEVIRFLASAYNEYQEFDKAARQLIIVANLSTDPEIQLKRLGEAAVAYNKAHQEKDAENIIDEMKKVNADADKKETIILNVLKQIAENESNDDKYLAYTERLLDLAPADNNMRFSLAYKYSDLKYNELALYHYTKIPYAERSSTGWNNIGVADDRLGLNGKAVEAYRKSEEMGETLAMSNLGRKYLDAGFFQEAEEVCSRALKVENYDKEVGVTIASIKTMQEEEDKKQKKALDNTALLRQFLTRFGHACAKQSLLEYSRVWNHPRCPLNVEIKDGKLIASGTYEQPALVNYLAASLAGVSALTPSKPTKYVIRYEGIVTGFAIKGTVSIEEVGKPISAVPSLLDSTKSSKDVLMIISDDNKEIRVWEKGAIDKERFYSLTYREKQ